MARDRRRDPERLLRLVPVVFLCTSLLILIVSTRSLMGVPERVGLTIFGFFQKGFHGVAGFVSGTVNSVSELRRLKKEYIELQKKLERFELMERSFADIQAENKRLKEQLGFSDKLAYKRIPVTIIAKDPENLYSTIVINKGVEEGIRKNMPVLAIQDGSEALVGKVLEVGRGSSLVLPVYAAGSYVAARLARTRHDGLVTGVGAKDGLLVMKYVRKRAREEAQVGDLVISSGYESIYPPNVTIGRISSIRAPDYQTSLEIDIEPALDFSRLEYLHVISISAGDSSPIPEGGVRADDSRPRP